MGAVYSIFPVRLLCSQFLIPYSPLMVISPDGDLRRKYLQKHT